MLNLAALAKLLPDPRIRAAYRGLAALATPALIAVGRVRLARIAHDIATRDHIADVSRRLRRSLACRAQRLSAPQLTALATMAIITGDAALRDATSRAMTSEIAMAYCVAVQRAQDERVACGRLVQALEIEERREYQPWIALTVVEVVL